MGAGWTVSKGSSVEVARRAGRLPSLALATPTYYGLWWCQRPPGLSVRWDDVGLRAERGYVLCDRLWLDHGGHLAGWLRVYLRLVCGFYAAAGAYEGASDHVVEACREVQLAATIWWW